MAKDVVNLVLRLPTSLHRRLTKEAKQNNVSLNTEIINQLEHYGPELDRATADFKRLTAKLDRLEAERERLTAELERLAATMRENMAKAPGADQIREMVKTSVASAMEEEVPAFLKSLMMVRVVDRETGRYEIVSGEQAIREKEAAQKQEVEGQEPHQPHTPPTRGHAPKEPWER